jgi:hypothetical protein
MLKSAIINKDWTVQERHKDSGPESCILNETLVPPSF